jgi:hypothetical protein
MTLVTKAQLFAFIDLTANLLKNIKIVSGFSVYGAIQLVVWASVTGYIIWYFFDVFGGE